MVTDFITKRSCGIVCCICFGNSIILHNNLLREIIIDKPAPSCIIFKSESNHAPPSYYTERYRSGHNENDSKFLEAPAVSSAENVRRTGLCAGSDFTISYRSCVFFLHSSGARITLEIYGELSERSKVRHSKSPSANGSPSSEKPLTVRVSGIYPSQAHREF